MKRLWLVLLLVGCGTLCPYDDRVAELEAKVNHLQDTIDDMYRDVIEFQSSGAVDNPEDAALGCATPPKCGLEDQ